MNGPDTSSMPSKKSRFLTAQQWAIVIFLWVFMEALMIVTTKEPIPNLAMSPFALILIAFTVRWGTKAGRAITRQPAQSESKVRISTSKGRYYVFAIASGVSAVMVVTALLINRDLPDRKISLVWTILFTVMAVGLVIETSFLLRTRSQRIVNLLEYVTKGDLEDISKRWAMILGVLPAILASLIGSILFVLSGDLLILFIFLVIAIVGGVISWNATRRFAV